MLPVAQPFEEVGVTYSLGRQLGTNLSDPLVDASRYSTRLCWTLAVLWDERVQEQVVRPVNVEKSLDPSETFSRWPRALTLGGGPRGGELLEQGVRRRLITDVRCV